jgi:GH24 family phage-related lysozyme (muramidase)
MTGNRKAAVLALTAAIAIPAEGLRQYAYLDPGGVPTVCYGHTGEVERGRQYSLEECDALLDADLRNAFAAVERCRPGLPDPVLAAFADAVYNLGPRVACDTQTSTAARYLRAGKLKEACNELPKWNKARIAGVLVPLPGLTKRRAEERETCLKGAAS